MTRIKVDNKTGTTKVYDDVDPMYDDIANQTTGEMMGEHLEAAFQLLKQVQPDCAGFQGTVIETPDGDTEVIISLLDRESK